MVIAINFISFCGITLGLLMQCYANGVFLVAAARQSPTAWNRAKKIRFMSFLMMAICVAIAFAAFSLNRQ